MLKKEIFLILCCVTPVRGRRTGQRPMKPDRPYPSSYWTGLVCKTTPALRRPAASQSVGRSPARQFLLFGLPLFLALFWFDFQLSHDLECTSQMECVEQRRSSIKISDRDHGLSLNAFSSDIRTWCLLSRSWMRRQLSVYSVYYTPCRRVTLLERLLLQSEHLSKLRYLLVDQFEVLSPLHVCPKTALRPDIWLSLG